jgi:hypothetical protein
MNEQLDFKRIAANDLAKHLDRRVEVMLHDFMERCGEIGIEYDAATALAITILGHYAACAARGVDATEEEYIETCRHLYRMLQKKKVSA